MPTLRLIPRVAKGPRGSRLWDRSAAAMARSRMIARQARVSVAAMRRWEPHDRHPDHSPQAPTTPPARTLSTGNGRRTAGPCSRDLFDVTRRKPMSDLQTIADRVEIEALRGESTDAAMMRDYD